MKNGKKLLRLRVETEAAEQIKHAEHVKMEIPEDAKEPEELLEELMDHFTEGKKTQF